MRSPSFGLPSSRVVRPHRSAVVTVLATATCSLLGCGVTVGPSDGTVRDAAVAPDVIAPPLDARSEPDAIASPPDAHTEPDVIARDSHVDVTPLALGERGGFVEIIGPQMNAEVWQLYAQFYD